MIKRALLIALLAAGCGQSAGSEPAEAAKQQQKALRDSGRRETALFAGGCFWSTEHAMEHVPGVVEAVSGFAGGGSANPTYEQVTGGNTGHREAVRVRYDPTRVSYGALVRRFLRSIDPTDDGGQACDRGPNYRSAVFALNAGQRREAQAALAEAGRIVRGRVVTPVLDAAPFYAAAEHHQDYARLNATRYGLYRRGCGRDTRLREVWGNQAFTP